MSLVALRMHLLLTLKEGSKYTRVERSGGQKTFFFHLFSNEKRCASFQCPIELLSDDKLRLIITSHSVSEYICLTTIDLCGHLN